MNGEISGERRGSDWSDLPADLLVTVFSSLEIPDLLSCGVVCRLWHAEHSSVRRLGLCSNVQGPCLVARWRGHPAPPLHRQPPRSRTWPLPAKPTAAADEHSELHLLDPIDHGRADRPPATRRGRLHRAGDPRPDLLRRGHPPSTGNLYRIPLPDDHDTLPNGDPPSTTPLRLPPPSFARLDRRHRIDMDQHTHADFA